MTEVERITQSGRISRDFLKPETRCDFYVDEKRKKIWTVELDLLMEFDRVCKKNGLRYFLAYGTLLGAVRHKGFIPWDDDIDVLMLREDYDRLIEVGQKDFQHPYFLQTPYTDKEYYFTFSKLRNSNTSAISYPFRYGEFNQGLFLDIFVLDNCERSTAQKRYDKIKELALDISAYMRMSNPNPSESDMIRIQNYSGRAPMDIYNEVLQIATRFNDKDTEYVSEAMITRYECSKLIYKKIWFDDVSFVNFEGVVKAPIPCGYESILWSTYNDYMQLPPVEKRGNWHNSLVVDPDIPYNELIRTLR